MDPFIVTCLVNGIIDKLVGEFGSIKDEIDSTDDVPRTDELANGSVSIDRSVNGSPPDHQSIDKVAAKNTVAIDGVEPLHKFQNRHFR
jgi:hypothetical protein